VKAFPEKARGRLIDLLQVLVFLGLVAMLLLFGGFWTFTYRPELLPTDVLLELWCIAETSIAVLCALYLSYDCRISSEIARTRSRRLGWSAKSC
jgi:hypothetical protein